MERIARTRMTAAALVAGSLLAASCGRGGEAKLAWGASLREALREAESARRPVLVLCVNEWDPWCRKLEAETLRDPEPAALLREYLLVRVDVEKDPAVSARLNVVFFPSLVALDHRGEELFRLTGFHNARQLAQALRAKQPRSPGA